jgi:hypothetical protein
MQKKMGIVLFIIMLLGIVAIPYYMRNNQISDEKPEEAIAEESQVRIFALDQSILSRIEIKDESVFTFEKREDKWIEPEFNTLAYDKEAIENIIQSISSLESIQVIHNAPGQSQYGIDDHSRMITLYDSSNNHYTLKLGSYTADKKGLYVVTDLNDTVYIVSSEMARPLFSQKEDLIEKQMAIPKAADIQSLDISKKDEPVIHIQRNNKVGYKDYETWVLEEFYKSTHEIHTETVDALLNKIGAFQKEKFVGNKTELEKYGLDEPYMVMALNKKWTIKFGKKENEFIYFMYSEEPYVYKMLEENIKELTAIKPIALIRKQVYIPELTTVNQIELSNPEQTLVLNINKVLTQQGENGLTSSIEEMSFDEMQTKQFIELIQDNICIEAELQNPEIEEKQERKAEISIRYRYEDGSEKLIELIPYDNHFYILRHDGTIEFAVGKEKVMNMFNMLHEMTKKNEQ